MRRIFGRVLLGLGAFLIAAGVVATVWAPAVVKKTPIDVDSTTYLGGTGAKLDTATGDFVPRPIKVTSITGSDTKSSSDNTVVFVNRSCVVFNDDGDTPDCVDGTDNRLITAGTDVFATDRVSGLAVSDKSLPAGTVEHQGLMNKWPFDSLQKTYPLWNGTIGSAVDAKYDGTETLLGLKTYRYVATIVDAPIDIAEGVPGTYDNVIVTNVEPKTGTIVNQSQDQQRYLADGTQVLDVKAAFTPEQVKADVTDAKDSVSSLDLITQTVPLVGFVGGLLSLLAGGALLFMGRRRTPAQSNGTKPNSSPSAHTSLSK